jgi:hypothetical protein
MRPAAEAANGSTLQGAAGGALQGTSVAAFNGPAAEAGHRAPRAVQGADAPVPVTVPDLPAGGGDAPVPDLSGIGDAPASSSPICRGRGRSPVPGSHRGFCALLLRSRMTAANPVIFPGVRKGPEAGGPCPPGPAS